MWNGARALWALLALLLATALVAPSVSRAALVSGPQGYLLTSPLLVADSAAPGQFGSIMPVGSILAFAGVAAPRGFLVCDGRAVSRQTYAELFAVIDTMYGAGDGQSTFQVPDLRAAVPVGANDNGAGGAAKQFEGAPYAPVGRTVGASQHTIQKSNLPEHTHTGSTATSRVNIQHRHSIGVSYTADLLKASSGSGFEGYGFLGNSGGRMAFGAYPTGYPWGHDVGFHTSCSDPDRDLTEHQHSFTTAPAGGIPQPQPFTLYQPSVAINYIIKY